MPKVSICVPVYNVEQYIGRCIESLISQTLRDIEIIFVNDCTKDNSMQIIEDYQKKDDRIKIINHDVNHGLMWTRRTGYMAATGDYITFCDSDDSLTENALELLLKEAIQTKADIVSGVITYIYNNGTKKNRENKLSFGDDKIGTFKSLLYDELGHNLCGKLFKCDLFKEYTYSHFDNFVNGEDAICFYEIVNNSKKTTVIQKVVYYYWQNASSSSQVHLSNERLENVVVANDMNYKICSQYNELKDLSWYKTSVCLNKWYIRGYSGILSNLIKKYSLEKFTSPLYMIYYIPLMECIKILIKKQISSHKYK